jgi:tetratricopeptide (TPR) repeat protein
MELSIEKALQQAIEAHKAGKLQEAEALYRAILHNQPGHPDANHNLGVLAVSLNKPGIAIQFIKIALESNPNQEQFWLSYIDALLKDKKFENAKIVLEQARRRGLTGQKVEALELEILRAIYKIELKELETKKIYKAIELRENGRFKEAQNWLHSFLVNEPRDAEAWSLLSQVYILDNKDIEAEKALLTAASINADIPSVHWNLARLLLKKSNPTEALKRGLSGYEISRSNPESCLVLAGCLRANGRDSEALPLIEKALQIRPNYAEAFANRALIRLREKNIAGAISDLEMAVSIKHHLTHLWALLGSLQYQNKNLSGAIKALEKAHALDTQNVSYLIDLGEFLRQDNKVAKAILLLEEATKLAPNNANAWANLGTAFQQETRIEEAKAAYEKALLINPKSAEISSNLGAIESDAQNWGSALKYFEKALSVKPELADAHNNLGVALKKLGRLDEAEASYRKAIELEPDFAEAYCNLGYTLFEKNNYSDALNAALKSIKIKPDTKAKGLFVEVTKKIRPKYWDLMLSKIVIEALLEPWGRPADINLFAIELLKAEAEFLQIISQSKISLSQVSNDTSLISFLSKKEFNFSPLLCAVLSSSPIPDAEMEIFLTILRRQLLQVVTLNMLKEGETGDVDNLLCSLAQQCFINEYIYFQTPNETETSHKILELLTKALENDQFISANLVIAVACYFPLYSVPSAAKLLNRNWSKELKAVLKQQIDEPLDELNLRTSIPCLTDIDNQISLAVQNQYEENPYPRWVRLPKDATAKFLNSNMEVLVAGCGTGQHPIGTALSIKGAKILAIDLSMSSLAYAKRKTIDLGIESIEYAQADILKLPSIDRTFDIIESSGVLHHLENPFEGWEVLLSLLRPTGLMKLGFYSDIARRDIVKIRDLINKQGIGSSSKDIRDYRQYLFNLMKYEDLGLATSSSDFFSTSACRDLLFHVQEHRMNLNILTKFLKEHELNFLGFEIESSVIRGYKNRFPNDSLATNLEQWHIYEEENPDTFIGMYQFWVQKNSSLTEPGLFDHTASLSLLSKHG